MKIMQMLVVGLAVAACNRSSPAQETFPGRHLGESTASPGANASKPQPLTPDDPRVMNVSATISPQQVQRATSAPAPSPAAPRTDATSSTPVVQPADIAPASSTASTPTPAPQAPPPPSTLPTPAPPPAPAPPQ